MAVSRSRKARAARRRLKRVKAADNDLTDEQWRSLLAEWGACAYCGAVDRALQRDCVLPISRGGRYTVTNVVPACGPCNASKCNDEVTGWLRRKKLEESRFLLRWAAVNAALSELPSEQHDRESMGRGEARGMEGSGWLGDLAEMREPGPV